MIQERILAARAERGWTQAELARRMGLSGPYGHLQVSQWETAKQAPSARNLIRLADAFGVSVDYLLGVDQ